MKLTNNRSIKSAKGMTLLELTVVILVLLSLISILFVGARAWKKGADRAASVMIIRNAQQAVRSYANMNNLNPGDTPTTFPGGEGSLKLALFGQGKFLEKDPTAATFVHPAGAGYKFEGAGGMIPQIGDLYIQTGGEGNSTGAAAASEYNPTATERAAW